ncbi:2-dehydropantoate 2-reductase (Ketopantoate reductase) (KPA reductase) (KPR) [Mucor velutinosus]|uniref:2-dehydropantoate 2-reductase (Ketopantoate reductase) (KPA reductase) (KPR) n=1 Tax=Mucor velutinosus TaxID=708070 RepID=A0AAN7DDH1_9FUNG|nr:2-dehydropantoate 2-reductase (Ketopantoate reductase) (KPA reductase) (KPR) [Mucor velutinosus]
MATAQGKKKLQNSQNKKIDSYFKPVSKSDASTMSKPSSKRQLENDENTPHNDEHRKKVLVPSDAEPIKRQFDNVKGGLSAKTNQTVIRHPLTDKHPKNPTIPSVSNFKTLHPKRKKPSPSFAVLCDEDIEKGVEKAPTPPIRDSQESFFDSQDVNSQAIDSQAALDSPVEDSQSLNSQTHGDSQDTPSQLQLNTQCIQEGDDLNTQWTAVTSSPINIYKDADAESQSFEDNDKTLSVMIPHIRGNSTSNKPSKENYVGKENEVEATEKEEQRLMPDEFLLPAFGVESPGHEESSVNNDQDKLEDEKNDFYNQDDDDDDDEENSDLFAKTVDTTIKFKDVPIARSSTALDDDDNGFFSDNNEQEESTTFFDLESDDDGPFMNPDIEFSVNEFESAPGESIKEPSSSYTLSLDQPESISQVHMPLPNPRGKDILEKLGYDKESSKDSSRAKDAEESSLSTL